MVKMKKWQCTLLAVMAVVASSLYVLGNHYFSKVELKDVDNNGFYEVFVWRYGGAHYTSLDIFKFQINGLRRIFSNGSACPVIFGYKNKISTIKVGRANWEKKGWNYASGKPLWEVYQWNSGKFKYKPQLSTTQPITESDEALRFVNAVT